MNQAEIAKILDDIGTMLEVKGENPFKTRAYHNASRTIGSLNEDLASLVEQKELTKLDGVGQAIAEKITELFTTGKLKFYEDLKKSMPKGIEEMIRIQGLGPKKIKVLFEQLKIQTVDDLKKAAEGHRLASIAGFGKKTEENILKGIEQLKQHADKHLFDEAEEAANNILTMLRKVKGVRKCEAAGSLRRCKEVIGDIDILASANAKDVKSIMSAFVAHPDVARILGQGETKSSVMLASGIQCDLRIVEEQNYPFALAYFTGSKEHNVQLRSLALRNGWSMNEYEFSKVTGGGSKKKSKPVPRCTSEAEIHASLGLEYIPPELRESMGEIDAAAAGKLPVLVEESDIKGTFHCHTTYSDGNHSLEEMAHAARDLSWQYIGIADHSKIAAYAGGLSEAKVKQQHAEIDKLNKGFKNFRIFKGTEVDILPDGTLDWSDKVLARFDFVVASIHSKFTMTEEEATKRLIRALKNKYVTMLGHPTGRVLLRRDGYPVKMTEVIKATVEYGKIIEINAHPSRLDMDWRVGKFASEQGMITSINPDAHSTQGLRDVRYGVNIARKAWFSKEQVLNTRTLAGIEKYLSGRK
ncbi:MAG TPA: DNA polymerase/3'-5' exonuclease PolX [Bacteroidota bacterium]|nr:DNA polymerase/3'-5' exonuclease PolX [Bacteroidota bacterium]